MSDADLSRAREDLDTIQQAAGLAPPFQWPDVTLTLGLVPAGAALSAWAYFGPADYLAFGLVPLLLVAVAAGVRQLWNRRDEGRRERAFDAASTLVVVAGLAVYVLWARQFGLVNGSPGAVACFFLGLLCAVVGLSSRTRRVYLAGAAALVPFGLVVPLCGGQHLVAAAGGLAVAIAGLVAAAVMASQLRAARAA